jgi:hypothetical protein
VIGGNADRPFNAGVLLGHCTELCLCLLLPFTALLMEIRSRGAQVIGFPEAPVLRVRSDRKRHHKTTDAGHQQAYAH